MNILILDDCEIARKSLSRILRQQGHKVSSVETPIEAFTAIDTGWPELLICDWDLGVNWPKGHKFIDSVKHIFELRCILHTGSDDYELGRQRPDAIVKKGDFESLKKALEA